MTDREIIEIARAACAEYREARRTIQKAFPCSDCGMDEFFEAMDKLVEVCDV